MRNCPTPLPMTPRQAGSLMSAEMVAQAIPHCMTEARKRELRLEVLKHLAEMHSTLEKGRP